MASVRRARLVIAGNKFLASHAARLNRYVEVVPSCVDPRIQPVREHRESEIPIVGWIGSATTSAYLAPLLPVLARMNRDRVRVRLVVVGGSLPVAEPWLEQRKWCLERQSEDLVGFDVGVMPLPDTEWARGKCGYKLLQYFSAGVPAVASPVGVNRALIGQDRGLLASTEAEWESALSRLLSDAEERADRGAAARSFVEREYSYERWAPDLAAMLRSLS